MNEGSDKGRMEYNIGGENRVGYKNIAQEMKAVVTIFGRDEVSSV